MSRRQSSASVSSADERDAWRMSRMTLPAGFPYQTIERSLRREKLSAVGSARSDISKKALLLFAHSGEVHPLAGGRRYA